MLSFDGYFARREIDSWRDEHTLIAARVLNQTAADLISDFAKSDHGWTWKDALLAPRSYLRRVVGPTVIEVADPIARMLVDDANRSLASIIDHQTHWSRQPMTLASAAGTSEGAVDVAAAVVPIAGGAALAAAIPSLAVSTTSGLLATGLFATTVISWPVVIIGGAAAATAVTFGLVNTARIRDKADARLHGRTAEQVARLLLGRGGAHPSILEQLETRYAEAAKAARSMW